MLQDSCKIEYDNQQFSKNNKVIINMNNHEKLYPSKILLLILKKIELLENIFASGVSDIINNNTLTTSTLWRLSCSLEETIAFPEEVTRNVNQNIIFKNNSQELSLIEFEKNLKFINNQYIDLIFTQNINEDEEDRREWYDHLSKDAGNSFLFLDNINKNMRFEQYKKFEKLIPDILIKKELLSLIDTLKDSREYSSPVAEAYDFKFLIMPYKQEHDYSQLYINNAKTNYRLNNFFNNLTMIFKYLSQQHFFKGIEGYLTFAFRHQHLEINYHVNDTNHNIILEQNIFKDEVNFDLYEKDTLINTNKETNDSKGDDQETYFVELHLSDINKNSILLANHMIGCYSLYNIKNVYQIEDMVKENLFYCRTLLEKSLFKQIDLHTNEGNSKKRL